MSLIRYVHFSQDSWVRRVSETKLRFNCGTQISQGKINAEKEPKNKPAAAKRMEMNIPAQASVDKYPHE